MKGKKLTVKDSLNKIEQDKIHRRKIFKELLVHVSQGLSLDCFGPLSVGSIRKYLETYKEEFVQEELDAAMREGKQCWETIGRRQSTGDCLGNSRSWYYNMANRYGWRDKLEVEAEHKGQVSVNIVSYASQQPSQDNESKE